MLAPTVVRCNLCRPSHGDSESGEIYVSEASPITCCRIIICVRLDKSGFRGMLGMVLGKDPMTLPKRNQQ